MSCENCKWWEETAYDELHRCKKGFCHRYPPVQPPLDTANAHSAINDHLVVLASGWCGEFQSKGKAAKPLDLETAWGVPEKDLPKQKPKNHFAPNNQMVPE